MIGKAVPNGGTAIDREGVVSLFRAILDDAEIRAAAGYPDDLSELRGGNRACWRPIGEQCHADVLLERANAPL